jgi:hypothetical protein
MEMFACVVNCKKCELFYILRYRKGEEKFDCQQILPSETRPLLFVCRACRTLSSIRNKTFTAKLQNTALIDDLLPDAFTVYRLPATKKVAACQSKFI